MNSKLLLASALTLLSCWSYCQEPSTGIERISNFPSRFIASVDKKINGLETQLEKQTVKYLKRLQKREAKLKRKLAKIDSTGASNLFTANEQYAALIAKVK